MLTISSIVLDRAFAGDVVSEGFADVAEVRLDGFQGAILVVEAPEDDQQRVFLDVGNVGDRLRRFEHFVFQLAFVVFGISRPWSWSIRTSISAAWVR